MPPHQAQHERRHARDKLQAPDESHACCTPQSRSWYEVSKLEVVREPEAEGLVSATLWDTAKVAANTTPCTGRPTPQGTACSTSSPAF